MAQRPYIVGNWKMHGTRAMLSEARAIDRAAERLIKAEVAVAPPFTLIHATAQGSDADRGRRAGLPRSRWRRAYRRHFRCDAEGCRRQLRDRRPQRTPRRSRRKRRCRESQGDRGAGGGPVGDCLRRRKRSGARCRQGGRRRGRSSSRARCPMARKRADRVTVAYEPVWAIGTGRTPSIGDIAAMHRAIRAKLSSFYGDGGTEIRILYGGSVKAENAAEILRTEEVGGALVGGGEPYGESFLGIIVAAADRPKAEAGKAHPAVPCGSRGASLSALQSYAKAISSMLITFLTVVRAIIAAALVGVVLMQRSEGGGLGMGGGGSPGGLMSARGAYRFPHPRDHDPGDDLRRAQHPARCARIGATTGRGSIPRSTGP